jgi:hypothetical protein
MIHPYNFIFAGHKSARALLFRRLRWLLSMLCLSVLLYAVFYTIHQSYKISPLQGVDDVPYNELLSEGMKTQVEFSQSLFQVGLLITASLWGTIIAKKDEAGIVLSDRPEMIMFTSASLLLLLSLIFHAVYLKQLTYILGVSGKIFKADSPSVFDVFNPNIDYLFTSQVWYLASGFIVAIITLFSAHRLKEN